MADIVLPEDVAFIRIVDGDDKDIVYAEMARNTVPNEFCMVGPGERIEVVEAGLDLPEALAKMIEYLTGKDVEVTIRVKE